MAMHGSYSYSISSKSDDFAETIITPTLTKLVLSGSRDYSSIRSPGFPGFPEIQDFQCFGYIRKLSFPGLPKNQP